MEQLPTTPDSASGDALAETLDRQVAAMEDRLREGEGADVAAPSFAFAEALAVYDDVVSRFGDDPAPVVREVVKLCESVIAAESGST
jgi:hypothetical protein